LKKITGFLILLIVAALLSCPNPNPASSPAKSLANPPVVSTLAGTTLRTGATNGPGASALFNFPNDVAVDAAGNVYVADYDNHRIRKITPGGVVSTFAGTGQMGATNGPGASAQFRKPRGVAVDLSGNVYVGDQDNHLIRKIAPNGVVSTFAGTGQMGATNGPGASAQFNDPRGVATDSSGNVYVADTFNHRIRKITPEGVVSTFAGDGTQGAANGDGASAQFKNPNNVATDSSGNVYVADSGNHLIRKITPEGVVSILAGDSTADYRDGEGRSAQFSFPYDVATDSSGNVYVADSNNHLIRKITAEGVVSTFAGTAGTMGGDDGAGNVAQFRYPTGVAADSSGNVYVADYSNHLIRKIE